MEAFSWLKFWRNAASDDATGGGSDTDSTTSSSETITTTTNDGRNRAVEIDDETDDDESFFDLEFTVPGCDDKEENHARDVDVNVSDSEEDSYNDLGKKDAETGSDFVESPNDVFFKGRGLPVESNSKPQSPISFLRSPPKFGVFMLFKKPKLDKTETADVSPATPKHHQQSKRFTVKCKVEEVPILSLLTRVNSSRSKLQRQSSEDASSKRYPKDMVQKYLNLIKPFYVKVSKKYSEKLKLSEEFSAANPSSSPTTGPVLSPSKQAEEKQGIRAAVCKQLGKSRSASSAAGIMPSPASRRDDSLLLQHDGIQSAILHCKRSYSSSREFSVLSRSTSDPTHEISVNPSRTSTEEEKKSSSI